MPGYTALPYSTADAGVHRIAVVREVVYDYLSDDEYAQLQQFLAAMPAAGDVIAGSGGCRRVRWATGGKGKRGGARIIYFVRAVKGQIWLLTIYSRSATEAIPAHVLRALRNELIDP